jgi:hypothetical protein
MFILLHIAQLIGNKLGVANCKFRDITVMMPIHPISDVRKSNKIKQLHREGFIQDITFVIAPDSLKKWVHDGLKLPCFLLCFYHMPA